MYIYIYILYIYTYIYMWDIQKQQMGCSMGSQWNKDEENGYRSPQVEDMMDFSLGR